MLLIIGLLWYATICVSIFAVIQNLYIDGTLETLNMPK